MKKYFKLKIESESFGGRVLSVEKTPLINIDLVELADKKERLVMLSSGTVLRLAPNDELFDYKEFWEVIEEDNNPFGRDRDSEMRDVVDAERWRQLLRYTNAKGTICIANASPRALTDFIDNSLGARNSMQAGASGNADFDEEDRLLAERFKTAKKLIHADRSASETGLWSGCLIDRLKNIFEVPV